MTLEYPLTQNGGRLRTLCRAPRRTAGGKGGMADRGGAAASESELDLWRSGIVSYCYVGALPDL